ncbi:MAG: glutathione S-transferase family protein [Nevskiaceae bacterium]|nr:MAG: glutathione S-transferase family protein [Nevskiaceae bacterium]TAM32756.1 MAG: glutathione S-transferase family protein [Nevskiaceae bacterium]
MALTLYQFPQTGRLPNDSPFCLKVQAYLRLAGLEYRCLGVPPFKSPTGKLPMLDDNGLRIPDSSAILAHLEASLGERALDAGLSESERAQGLAIQRLVEEHLYWALLWMRWIDPAGWPATLKSFFGALPPGPRQLVGGLIRRKLRRDARGHGLGLLSREQILHRAEQDLATLAALLGGQAYFLGAAPRTVDACVYGLLGNILGSELRTPLTELAERHANLKAYCARLQARCFPELNRA